MGDSVNDDIRVYPNPSDGTLETYSQKGVEMDEVKGQTEPGAEDVEMGTVTGSPDDRDAKQKAKAILDDLRGDITYAIEDVPPWYSCILLGFQHYLTMFGSTVAIPLILAEPLCIKDNLVAQAELIGTIFFVSGLATLIQSLFGVRLPIVQSGSFAFFAPALAILGQAGPCPSSSPNNNSSIGDDYGEIDETEVWQSRMRMVQGAIMVASLVEVIIGFTGIVGLMLRYIGPLTIAPTITLIGLSLFSAATDFSSGHWGIAFLTIGLMALFSQYIARFPIPCLGYSKEKGLHGVRFPIFKLFPVILSVLLAWVFSAILTAFDVFPADPEEYGHLARTDLRLGVLEESAWIRFPYPGQWGVPTVTVAGVFGMLAAVLASIFESVGDYYACARLAGAPPPPVHAINRGIGVEGVGCVLAGAFGTGAGTTSYGENIGALGITKVGSRRAIQFGAALMLIMGMFSKFGALFVTIPDPIIGGMFCVMFGMVAAVGLSNLQFVNMNSSRNLFVMGFSLIMGFIIPSWISGNESVVSTGVKELDQIFIVLLKTNMFVGGVIGFFLDNTLPGSDEDRGIAQWSLKSAGNQDPAVTREVLRCYDFPVGMGWVRRVRAFRFVPFCPTFDGWRCMGLCRRPDKCRKRSDVDEPDAAYSPVDLDEQN